VNQTTKSSPETLHSLPISKATTLIELVKRWDVSADLLLEGLDLNESALADPDSRLSIPTLAALVDRARALTGEPGLGFYIGLYRRLLGYEALGLASRSVGALRDALEFVVQYAPIVTSAVTFKLNVEGSGAAFIIDENADFGSIRDYACFSLLMSLWPVARILTRTNLNETVHLAFPEPQYYSRFAHLMPKTRFDQPRTQILFDASLLPLPIIALDRPALMLAREQCEREFTALGFRQAIVERVRSVLPKPGGFRSLEEVAAALHASPRTLRRQLAAKRVGYFKILEHERREKALLLLRSSTLTLEEVSEYVGYATVSNFIRAFRRWTGETPAAYRRIATKNPPNIEQQSYE
jgi:AraC-like DNA-binding protein